MPRKKRDAVKICILIDRELLKRLDEFCEKSGRTKTRVVEMAVEQYLKNNMET